MKILALTVMLCLSGCVTPYVEMGVGYKTRSSDGLKSCSRENFVGRAGVERELTEHVVIKGEYEHISHVMCGSPFNTDPDESTDHIGVVVRYQW